jgi:hypothetical protein
MISARSHSDEKVMDKDPLQFELTADDALVLFEFLAREADSTPVAHLAERCVLWKLEGALESRLKEVLSPSYDRLVALARARIAGEEAPGERSPVPLQQDEVVWQQDLRFYADLGIERASVTCRSKDCTHGAVPLSVLCRRHHFEAIIGRPCPFTVPPTARELTP